MVVKHCSYGLCTSDNPYPDKMSPGTYFIPFAKPGVVKDGMTKFDKNVQKQKTERAKNGFTPVVEQIYIPSHR